MIALNANHPAAQRQQTKPTLTELARQISTPTPALDTKISPFDLALNADDSIPTFLKRKMPKDMTPEERREADNLRKRNARAAAKLAKQPPSNVTIVSYKKFSETMRDIEKMQKAKPRKPGERARYDWGAADQKAAKGTVPTAPDFSAQTHRYYRPHLDACAKLARAGDLKGLEDYEPKFKLKPYCSSRTPLARYRLLCIKALRVKS